MSSARRVGLALAVLGCGETAPPGPPPAPPTPPAVLPNAAPVAPTRAATSPAAVPPTPEVAAARERLAGVVRAHAPKADNPWAVGHALIALGDPLVLDNGEDAVDWLFSEYADLVVVEGHRVIRFPARRGEERVEPHTDLVLKALTEAGVGPERVVRVDGEAVSVGALWQGSLLRAWVDGEQTGFDSWNDTPWALQGLSAWAPGDLAWTAEGGHPMTLDAFTSASVARLRGETAFLREAMARGEPVEKRGQGIFSYTCGGAHLFQGAAYAAARGYGTESDRAALAEELLVALWRLRVELPQVDALLERHPEYAVILLEQRLKFLGHLLETTHRAYATGIATPTQVDHEALALARGQLVMTVQALDQLGVFDRLDAVRAADEQVYLDFVGDSAHAVRGLDLDAGVGVVRY